MNFEIKLTEAQLNLVIKGIAELPLKECVEVFNLVQSQAKAQAEAAKADKVDND